MQVPTLEQHLSLEEKLDAALARLARLEASQPEWVREDEAQKLTGLSQSTLARERKKPDTLLEVTSSGPLLYKRSSLDAFNQARLLRRTRLAA